mgnify:CR=1 FL=1
MHILESYALQNDLKIDKPVIFERFFPLAVEDYVTIDTSTLGTSSLAYDHWQQVVDLISPILNAKKISMIQLGDRQDKPLTSCYMAIGQCNFNQKAYVIKGSKLHISTNNESMHLASHYNKKTVALFPDNCFPEQFFPYWSAEEDVEIFSPESKNKPSFSPNENPKSINKIRPEDVAFKILDLMGISAFSPEYKTLRIGSSFYRTRIESTLTHLLDPNKLKVSSIIIRMDLSFNEEALRAQLETCPCSVITNRPFNHEILDKYSSKIAELVYYIEEDDPDGVAFVAKAREKSINLLLRSRAGDDEISDYKLAYFDYGLIHQVPRRTQDDFPELKGKKNLYYKSKHFIIHNTKFYPSSATLLGDEFFNLTVEDPLKLQNSGFATMEHEPQPVIDDPLFWEEEEHLHFFEKNS